MTAVELRLHVQEPHRATTEWKQVKGIARRLHRHLNQEKVLRRIAAVNKPRASSADIQATFADFARTLGFESEKKGLFAGSEFALRPDYYLDLGEGGVLLEVERGKTTINNMDLLDFWKCHLCPGGRYLFLLVPRALRQNETMTPRNEFATVDRRLATFFQPGSYTNVRGLALFGY
ncbi:MAG: hypothetical protein AAF533_08405 [Acidobacteriota bacterium]